MTYYCCGATGLSSHAIAQAFGYCCGEGRYPHHPHDPADLLRCLRFCDAKGITPTMLAARMAPVSPEWAALAAEWPELQRLIDEEKAEGTGVAPRTYARMRELIDGARRHHA